MWDEPCSDLMIESVIAKYRQRSTVGVAKYGTTLARDDLNQMEWLQHAQEEAMDEAAYLEVLIRREGRRNGWKGYLLLAGLEEANG